MGINDTIIDTYPPTTTTTYISIINNTLNIKGYSTVNSDIYIYI